MYIHFEHVVILFFVAHLIATGIIVRLFREAIAELRGTNALLRGEEVADQGAEYEMSVDAEENAVEQVEMFTEEELAYLKKKEAEQRAFEERIRRIKEEISGEIPDKPRTTGIEAEVLAEGIENLPHDSITHTQTKPPVLEVSE